MLLRVLLSAHRGRDVHERVAALEAAEAENPWYVATARRLCALKGLTFSRLTTGSITSEPHIMRWGIETTEEVFYMVIGPEEAELQEAETGKVLGTVPLGT